MFEQLNDLIRKDSRSFDQNERAMNNSDKENAHYEDNHFMVRVCMSQFWGFFQHNPTSSGGEFPTHHKSKNQIIKCVSNLPIKKIKVKKPKQPTWVGWFIGLGSLQKQIIISFLKYTIPKPRPYY